MAAAPPPTPLRAVIFDFDYTLADASDGIVDCVGHALSAMGLPAADPAAIRRTIGLSLPRTFEALTAGLAAQQLEGRTPEDFTAHFLNRSEQIMVKKTNVYTGSRDAVASLRRRGLATAIASSKYRRRISAVLELHGLTELFDFVVGGEDVPEGEEKPQPTPLKLAAAGLALEGLQPAQCLYVGDHTVDVLAARAAGMQHLSVLTGEATLSDFEAAGLVDVPRVGSIADVPEHVEALMAARAAATGSKL